MICLKVSVDFLVFNGEGEGGGLFSDFFFEFVDVGNFVRGNFGFEVFEFVGFFGESSLDFFVEFDVFVDIFGDVFEVGFVEVMRGYSGSINMEIIRGKSVFVVGDGVFVVSDVDLFEESFDMGIVKSEGVEVEEDYVGVGIVRDEFVVLFFEDFFEGFGVGNNFFLVSFEFGGGGLFEGNGKSGDGVVVGVVLVFGEDGEVDFVFEVVEGFFVGFGINGVDVFVEEDYGIMGIMEGFVSGGGDDIGIFERSGDDVGGNEIRDVGNVDNEVGIN